MSSEMKPFNLDAARKGAKMVTRSGDNVLEFHYFESADSTICIAAVTDTEIQRLKLYTSSGRPADAVMGVDNRGDLLMVPLQRVIYVNFYDDGIAVYHETEERARHTAHDNNNAFLIAAAIPVTLEV